LEGKIKIFYRKISLIDQLQIIRHWKEREIPPSKGSSPGPAVTATQLEMIRGGRREWGKTAGG